MFQHKCRNFSDVGNSYANDIVDFTNFKSLTTKLDLVVCSAKKINRSIMKHADKITSSVDTLAETVQVWKFFVSKIRSIQISKSYKHSRDTKLANCTTEDKLVRTRTKNMSANIVERWTNV